MSTAFAGLVVWVSGFIVGMAVTRCRVVTVTKTHYVGHRFRRMYDEESLCN